MRKFQCLLFVLKRSYICCYIICMTVPLTIKNCFEKCGIKGDNELMEVEEDDDLEFEALVNEFTTDISAAEYATFDENVLAF